MHLVIRGAQEPRSLLARDHRRLGSQQTLLMPSGASRELERELRRYCANEIEGRSFLVAGHRGSGKTTVVDAALLRLRHACADEGGLRLAVPAYLHAPALVDGGPSHRRPPTGAEWGESVLKLALLALHRAVVGEFVRAYRHHVLNVADASHVAPGRAELAAQFEIEITEAPGPARLREFWALAGALDSGVLFSRNRKGDGRTAAGEQRPPDQGLRELVALTGIGHVYQRIAGELRETDNHHQSHEAQRNGQVGFDSARLDLAQSALPLLAGAAVGAGAAVHSGLPGAAAGVAAYFLAAAGTRWTSSRSEKRSRQIDRTFVPDLSVQTLDRVVPALLERLRAAGIAPVFVIDELDKVDDLWDLMEPLIRDFKKVFAELALTCLIVDRAYYEQLLRAEREQPLGRSFSYFMHRLFVEYTPGDVDAYLEQRLAIESGAATSVAESVEILRWALRHRGEFNALKLQRELAALPVRDGADPIDAGELRSDRRWRAELTFQLAIELQLADEPVASWIGRSTRHRQVLYDALYYLPRRWRERDREDAGASIDLSDGPGRQKFADDLRRRVDLDPVVADSSATRDPHASGLFSADEIAFLFERVKAMAAMLGPQDGAAGNPFEQAWLALHRGGQDRVRAAGLVKPSPALLDAALWGEESLIEVTDKSRLRWRDRSPTLRRPSDHRGVIRRYFVEWLVGFAGEPGKVDVFGELVRCGLLPTAPDRLVVERAIGRLDKAGPSTPGTPTTAQRQDLELVASFALMLARNAGIVRKALTAAAAIGATSRGPARETEPDTRDWKAIVATGFERLAQCIEDERKRADCCEAGTRVSGSEARSWASRGAAIEERLRTCLAKLCAAGGSQTTRGGAPPPVACAQDLLELPQPLRRNAPNSRALAGRLQHVIRSLQPQADHAAAPQRQNGPV